MYKCFCKLCHIWLHIFLRSWHKACNSRWWLRLKLPSGKRRQSCRNSPTSWRTWCLYLQDGINFLWCKDGTTNNSEKWEHCNRSIRRYKIKESFCWRRFICLSAHFMTKIILKISLKFHIHRVFDKYFLRKFICIESFNTLSSITILHMSLKSNFIGFLTIDSRVKEKGRHM